MALGETARRRWVGAVVLLVALGMLIAGQTFLEGRLGPKVLLIYWLVCTILAGMAIWIAFADLRALAQRTRREHRELLEDTLREIEADARARRQKPGGKNGQG